MDRSERGPLVGMPAARAGDPTAHGIPLTGTGSASVWIRSKPAWRAVVPAAGSNPAVATLQTAQRAARTAIETAEAATLTAIASGFGPAIASAKVTEQAVKAQQAGAMATAVASAVSALSAAAGPPDVHACTVPLPVPPHGPGVVPAGSATVFIGGYAAARQGDQVLEAVGPPNSISGGAASVVIG